jgi:prophage DNA circulation protein
MTKTFKAAAMAAAFTMVVAMGMAALPQAASAQPYTVQSEMASHPRIVEAIRHMEAAYQLLQQAPYNFGGNKAQAMADTRRAIHSLRRALFYRLNWDDAAIDRYVF